MDLETVIAHSRARHGALSLEDVELPREVREGLRWKGVLPIRERRMGKDYGYEQYEYKVNGERITIHLGWHYPGGCGRGRERNDWVDVEPLAP